MNGTARSVGPYLEGVLGTSVATAAGVAIEAWVGVPNISLIYVVPVLIAAVRHGLVPSLCVTAVSVLCFNFFFLPPLYHFSIADPANVVAFFFLMFVAVVASALGTRVRAQAELARREARINAELYALSGKIAGVTELEDLLWIIVSHLARALNAEIVMLIGDSGRLEQRAAFPPDSALGETDWIAANQAWATAQAAGKTTHILSGGRWLFVPIRTGRSPIGVVGVLPLGEGRELTPSERELLDAVGNQVAVAIERMRLAGDIDQARLGAERERLRSSMLTSVSHDLRTPLASIIGGLSSLSSHGERYDDATRRELLDTALSEAERLDRFVGNLLDMTRLDAGAIQPRREPVDVGDLISTALRRAKPALQGRAIASTIEAGLPPLSLDFVLAEQVLFNLLDNAVKYSPPDGRIEVAARRAGDRVEIAVRDDGPGIPPGSLGHLFEKFYRADAGDRRRAGTGLGLAIAKGFVEAQGGTIAARNRNDRSGAEFVVTYPVPS